MPPNLRPRRQRRAKIPAPGNRSQSHLFKPRIDGIFPQFTTLLVDDAGQNIGDGLDHRIVLSSYHLAGATTFTSTPVRICCSHSRFRCCFTSVYSESFTSSKFLFVNEINLNR